MQADHRQPPQPGALRGQQSLRVRLPDPSERGKEGEIAVLGEEIDAVLVPMEIGPGLGLIDEPPAPRGAPEDDGEIRGTGPEHRQAPGVEAEELVGHGARVEAEDPQLLRLAGAEGDLLLAPPLEPAVVVQGDDRRPSRRRCSA